MRCVRIPNSFPHLECVHTAFSSRERNEELSTLLAPHSILLNVMDKLMNIIHLLARSLNEDDITIKNYLAKAPLKYKVFAIPKRTHGHRIIAQPARELKRYQRAFINYIEFPIHDCASAYIKNRSIKNNAEHHKENSFLLKMDLENFFNSITPQIFWDAWRENFPLPDKEQMYYFERLLFWDVGNNELVLSVGAPSSPMVSNFCMYLFDSTIYSFCKSRSITYTRYADDLTFTTNLKSNLFDIPNEIQVILKNNFSDQIKINRSKTKFSSKAHNRHITGITITNDNKISIGRNRKRYIKHLIHQFSISKMEQSDLYHLKGLISFAMYIEPEFFNALTKNMVHLSSTVL